MEAGLFHPAVEAWFARRFGQPTEAQAAGWPAIAQGRHTLIAAPTGSGKTLAAFLNAVDGLARQAATGELADGAQVVYVSPLKALANDVRHNLLEPLEEIAETAREMGLPFAEIRAAVRTGDTPAKERALNAKRPPHILITTPESLFILLTSESGRRGLTGVRTLILDELHAVAPNKRGAHLSISVERLCRNSKHPITRVGLSATQRPIEEMARFLTGAGDANGGGPPDCAIVDVGHRRAMDLAIELPDDELGPIATHEQWAQALDAIAKLVEQHRSTLVFVNTRRLVERVAHLLSERLGEERVAAHHGSLSRERRLESERRLREGEASVCVATASLELGIDIGEVDLACLIGSPRNIGTALQRVGRSGHFLGGTPKGRFFPLTRDELVETVALIRAMRAGKLDALTIPPWPLDVLAQQIVAATVGEEWWGERELYEFVRRAHPYRELPYERYQQALEVLVEGVAGRWGRNGAYLYRDGVNGRVKARRGGRIAAVTSGGAIPDTGDYLVMAEPEGVYVGSVNEDFAIESVAGDIFLLGNAPWQIRRVEAGVMRVAEAHGKAPTIPFWLGEAPGRTPELSEEVSEVRREVDARLHAPERAAAWLMEQGASREAAEQVVAYVEEGKRVLGLTPTRERVIAERFFDEAGGMQLVIHSPWGSRVNRAWGLALRKRLCRTFDFELQAAATDDGINISLGPQHSFPAEEVFGYVKAQTAEPLLTQAVFQSPVFGTRWRWTASRALALLRQVGGKRIPTPIQRMRSDDLLAAVFPAQAACQDNRLAGEDIEPPDHPLVFETLRDCLTEALDLAGLQEALRAIESGRVEVYGKDTVQPSAFSHQILNAMPYAFLDDAPLEERRARAVTLRRALPEDARDLGALDQEAVAAESTAAWPAPRDADDLHDALLTLALLPDDDINERADDPAQWREWLGELGRAGRAMRLRAGGKEFRLATERSALVASAYPDGELSGAVWGNGSPHEQDVAIADVVRGRVECTGPFTIAELADRLALSEHAARAAAARLESEGVVLRGRYRQGAIDAGVDEYCDRRILARIHRATIGRLRSEIEPVPAASYLRFLLEWQHATPSSRLSGEAGLMEVVEQLQGFEAAAQAWESAILPARVRGYAPSMLDQFFFNGEAVWGRFARRAAAPSGGISRNSPVSLALRQDTPWLLDALPENAPPPGAAAEVYDYLQRRGASFLPDIVAGVRRLPSDVEDALWQLVAAGRVTADGFGALRGLISGAARRAAAPSRRSRFAKRPRLRSHQSRWTLLHADGQPLPLALGNGLGGNGASARTIEEETVDARAAQLLRRYGVVCREALAREQMAPPWRMLLRSFRRAEARGEIRGGRFVAGFVGEQFALPDAVDTLRTVHKRPLEGEAVRLSAADPLNLVGILTPGARVPAAPGNEVVYRDGAPVEAAAPAEVGAGT